MKTAERLSKTHEYYFSKKLREVSSLVSEGKPIINLGIGSPDLLPPERVLKAINAATVVSGANQYQSYQGLPALREAMSQFYKMHFGVTVDSRSEIMPLMGSKEGIMHISLAFLNPGDAVLIPNPGYPTYTSVTELVGASPLYYDLLEENRWQPNFEDIEKQDLSKVKLMWVNYPHMPTGAHLDFVNYKKLVDFAKRHNILIVNDNPYSFVLNTNQTSIFSVEGSKDVALELNSLSKTFNMSGWRVGMVAGHAEHIQAVLTVKSNMDSGMYYPIQIAAIEALKTDVSWLNAQNKIYAERQALVFELAEQMHCTLDPKASGLFVWAKLPKNSPSAEAFVNTLLYDKFIFVAPGHIFGSKGEGYIRFSLCVDTEKIREATNRF